jgi:uncharacterized protein
VDTLTAEQGRVIGSLIEKQLLTPQLYPLTLNALVAACNQTSSRDPVTSLGEDDVRAALEELKAVHLVRFVLPSHGRSVVRYRHVLDERLGLDAPQLAVLAVLVLRGPQTVAELRSRTERMAEIGSVDHELELLNGLEEPLVELAPRRAGQKEDRWAQLLCEPPHAAAAEPVGTGVVTPGRDLDAVVAELADLRDEVAALRAAVAELRDSLGG